MKMIHCGVEMIMAPRDADLVLDVVEREFDTGDIVEKVIHSISNHELFTSKVVSFSTLPFSLTDAFEQARNFKK